MIPKKILLIDDDATFQKILSDKLTTLNFIVTSAFDAKSGLDIISHDKPDLILLDVNMPKLNGIEFLKQFQSDRPETERTPVLIVSNLSNMDVVSRGIELGIKGYIVKSDESLDGIIKNVNSILYPNS